MKVTKKSFHAWLYKFTYIQSYPNNLCPYFWKLVWAFIILIPNFIAQIPGIIIQKVNKSYDDCDDRRQNGYVFYILSALLGVYIYTTYHWIKMMLNTYSYDFGGAIFGLLINVAIFIVLIAYFIRNYRRKHKFKYQEKRPNIIVEFAKATYGKYCPKLEWEKE